MVARKQQNSNTNNTLEIHLKRFKPSSIKTNRVCVAVGKKGTGKSTVIQELMWFQQNIPVGVVMSATEEANEAYSEMVPPLFLYKEFDADALLRIVNRQKKMKSMYKQNGDKLPFDHRAFVLIDDCMYDKKSFRSPLIRELFMNGRHWDLFVLITMQYIMDLTVEIRSNTDYIFALKENIRKNRERLFNEFFGVFPNFAVFDALFLEVTQDYRCLVLDNTVPSTSIEDCVFWYKASERPSFKIGSEWFWEFGSKNTVTDGMKSASETTQQLEEMKQKAVKVVYETGGRRDETSRKEETSRRDETNRRDEQGGSSISYGRPPPRQNMNRQPQQEMRAPPSYGQEWDYGNAYPGYKNQRSQAPAYDPMMDVREQPCFGPSYNVYDESAYTRSTKNVAPQRAAYSSASLQQPNLYASYTDFQYGRPDRFGGFV